jgi:hypothetical protein
MGIGENIFREARPKALIDLMGDLSNQFCVVVHNL